MMAFPQVMLDKSSYATEYISRENGTEIPCPAMSGSWAYSDEQL